jgi:Asp-tRNA(Asn)/Glu-tRNA(Gln) amidotransferase A subunit family amidase
MALSWTMDKLGPIARSANDCALILDVICGPDGKDASVYPAAYFNWVSKLDPKSLRVGYLKRDFDPPEPFKLEAPPRSETVEEKKKRQKEEGERRIAHERRAYDHRYDVAALDKLGSMGIDLIPIELPKLPYGAMVPLLTAEAAAAFDDLTLSGRDRLLTEQGIEDWPNAFRTARFYPAIEYIQANRARTLAMQQVSALFDKVDIIVASSGGMQLLATNLTGHPALIVPNGLRGSDAPKPAKIDTGDEDDIGGPGTPVSITFLAGLYDDARLAAFAQVYQDATGSNKAHPKLD